MIRKGLFRKPANRPEGDGITVHAADNLGKVPDELCIKCTGCGKVLFRMDLKENLGVCPYCGEHFPLNSRNRIRITADPGSFTEMYGDMTASDILGFPGYDEKIRKAEEASQENESVLCGTCAIGGVETCIFVMNYQFMMGSMGYVTGEKITRLFEYAAEKELPVVGFTVSGGARMQEGIIALMQMAKTSAAVKKHSEKGLLYITVLTNPTTGGVSASFAMLGDIIFSEPGALIGFAGPRVIEQTIRKKLPEGFQRAEFVLETGFIDMISDRKDMKKTLAGMLELHCKENLV